MNEKAEILFDAVTGIRPELVERALDAPIRRRPVWRRYAALAACLALIVGGAFALSQVRMGSSGGDGWTTGLIQISDSRIMASASSLG